MRELKVPFDSDFILKNKRALKKALLSAQGSFIQVKIAILSGSTVGEIKNILELFLLDYGIQPHFYEGGYNRFFEEAVFDNPELDEFSPDIIYIHTSSRNINTYPSFDFTEEQNSQLLNATFGRFFSVWEKIQQKYGCCVIQNNFEPLNYRIMGNADCYKTGGRLDFINKLNNMFYDFARKNNNFYINDINYLAARYGLDNWSDNQNFYLYKYALATDAIPDLCNNIANIIKSIYGKNKKALVLDCDNTLWGGVIGDDGAENIAIGEENAESLAYLDFQRYIKEIAKLGVSLNICSKNEHQAALSGFLHPASVLKAEDFICFKADWEDKHVNIREILVELNILPDSAVFVDDNPAEREAVMSFLPQVAVPMLEGPEAYIKNIDRCGYFEVTNLVEDDLKRNKYYKENKFREAEQLHFGDYADYLKSLDMKCHIASFKDDSVPRITQLINKTNQFNFTTRRYSEHEITNIMNSPNHITLFARLSDKFGDNGIVSALIASVAGHTAVIDLWVMSCRVFKRELEFVLFDYFVATCKAAGINKIEGIYIKSAKNTLLCDFYEKLGFKKTGETAYEMKIKDYETKKYNMEVI